MQLIAVILLVACATEIVLVLEIQIAILKIIILVTQNPIQETAQLSKMDISQFRAKYN